MQKLAIDEFLFLVSKFPVLDVRSPGEYAHAHIPGAYSLPLFSDEERKTVGTLYKQQGREQAIKAGLDFFGVKMRPMVEQAERIINTAAGMKGEKTVLVHCWRGGMRSAAIAWLLDLYGFKVFTLAGGYKSFRRHMLAQLGRPYSFSVIGGYTGSGKTNLLHEMAAHGHTIIDLEGIARHRGSAFGGLGKDAQPSPEQFENELGLALYDIGQKQAPSGTIWVEDESRRIGDINLPNGIWECMRRSPVYFLDVPFEERLEHIMREYGQYGVPEIIGRILRIQKRLGGLATKNAINSLIENDYRGCFSVLLRYYDKYYSRDIEERPSQVFKIVCDSADAKENIQKLMNQLIHA